MNKSTKNEIKNIDFVLKIMIMKYNHLCEASNVLDQKIGISIGFVATTIAGLVILLSGSLDSIFFTFGLFSIYFSLLTLFSTLLTKKYKYPPDANNLYSSDSLDKKNIDLKNQIIADIKKSFEDYHDIHEKKAESFDLAIRLLVLGITLVIIGMYTGI